jgi:predicted CXXCH cytochrome family protein
VGKVLGRDAALGAALGAAILLIGAGIFRFLESGRSTPAASETAARPPAYVDNQICLGCHVEEGQQWQESHHAKAMEPATVATVRGDFSNRVFEHRGVISRFFKRGDSFFVNTEGPDGSLADFQIKYTFGVLPLQQYLIEMPGGRLQPLGIAWDEPGRKWFHLLPHEKTPPGDVLHWTGRYQTANTMCLVCHTTNFEKGYEPAKDTFHSKWSEPNVSCQSCHGPGERHVAWEQSQQGAQKSASIDAQGTRGLTVDLKRAAARKKTENCAPCHSRRSELVASPAPGAPLLDDFLPSFLVAGLYHDDGQQLDEVYVDGSFRQSLMHQKGVTCTDCHNAHTGKLKLQGNAVCAQCHRTDPNPRFPGAAGNFDSPAHHFHKPESKGAECGSCHMPSRTYMQIQSRPDHAIRVPRPDVSVRTGTPNACTNCHDGKSAKWAADVVARWYGPKRRQEPHYGEAFTMARSGQAGGSEALLRVIQNQDLPTIVRASALLELRRDPSTGSQARIDAARDPDPEMRLAAADGVEGLSPEQRLAALVPLLKDPVRAVRITAARNLTSIPSDRLGEASRPAFEAALSEYIAAQSLALDMPGGNFNLAVVYENTSRPDLAERHYLDALRIDPDFSAARANLAVMYSGLGRNADAERVLVEGLKRQPEIGELQYSLGLLLAEGQRLVEAEAALAKASVLLSSRADVRYNHGLALQQLGRNEAAETELLAAQKLDPRDPGIPYALAIFYSQTGRPRQALNWAERLREMRPLDPQVNRLVAELRGKM